MTSNAKTIAQLDEVGLRIKEEIDYHTYMTNYDSLMSHFSLVILCENGNVYPVGDPWINPLTDGLIDAVNYITDELPDFQQLDKFKRIFRVNDCTFLTDCYFEFYKMN